MKPTAVLLSIFLMLSFASAAAATVDEPIQFDRFVTEFFEGVEDVQQIASTTTSSPRSAEEARVHPIGRERFESWASEVADAMEQALQGDFAGAAIHPLLETLYIGTTTAGDLERAELGSIIAQTHAGYNVLLVDVPTTVLERDEAMNALAAAGITDFTAQTLEDRINVFVDTDAELRQVAAALGQANADLSVEMLDARDPIIIGSAQVRWGSLSDEDDSLHSGVTAFNSSGNLNCTFGFNMVRLSDGERFATSAQHCGSLYRNGLLFSYYDSDRDDSNGEDWQIRWIPPAIEPAQGQVWVNSSWQIDIYGPWRSSMSGQSRSMKGAVSGYTTGTYTGTCQNYPSATYTRAPGDSGGPVIYPYSTPRAAGLHQGPCDVFDESISGWRTAGHYTGIYNVELADGSTRRFRVLEYNE